MSSRSCRRRRRTRKRWISAIAGAACAAIMALTYTLASANTEAGATNVKRNPARGDGKTLGAPGNSGGSPDALQAPGRQRGYRGSDDLRRPRTPDVTPRDQAMPSAGPATASGSAPYRRRSTAAAPGFAASFGGLGGGGGFSLGASPSSENRSVFSGLETADDLTDAGDLPVGDEIFNLEAIASRSPDFDPCASGGLVVSPCFRPYIDPCPPGGLVVSPCFNGTLYFADGSQPASTLAGATISTSGSGRTRGLPPAQSPPKTGPGPDGGEENADDDDWGDDTTSVDLDVVAVPAPASALLLALGLVLLARRPRS